MTKLIERLTTIAMIGSLILIAIIVFVDISVSPH